MERMEARKNYYTTHNEDARLTPKHGMVEFLTTIRYIEKYLKSGMRILEIGAGTGRYSPTISRRTGMTWMQSSLWSVTSNTFDMYMKFHFCICERGDMVGASSHMLDVFRKR